MSLTPDLGVLAIAAFFVVVFALSVRDNRRRKARRNSLRRAPDGSYVWIDFDGAARRSANHPEKPGGAWYDEPGGDGYSGGDGGDGGGD